MKLYVFPGTSRHVNRAEVIDMIETGKVTQNAAIYDEGAPPSSVCAVKDHVDFKGTTDFDAAVLKATTSTTAAPIRTATPTPTTTSPTPATTPTAPTNPAPKKDNDFNWVGLGLGLLCLLIVGLLLASIFGGPKVGWGKGIEERLVVLENRPVSAVDSAAIEAAKKAAEDAEKRAAAAETKANAAIAQSRDLANVNVCPGGNLEACVASLKGQGVAEKFGREACASTCVN